MVTHKKSLNDFLAGLLVLLISATSAALFGRLGFPYADSGFKTYHSDASPWFLIVDFFSNAVFKWRVNALLSSIPFLQSYDRLICLLVAVFGAGVFRLTWQDNKTLRAAVVSIATVEIVLGIFGFNTLVWCCLVWFPWHIFCARKIIAPYEPKLREWIAFVLVTILLTEVSGPLAPILIVISLFSSGILYFSGPRAPLLVVASLVPAIWFMLTFLRPQLPSYPTDGHVVPAMGTVLGYWADIGTVSLSQVIHQGAIREALRWTAPLIFILSLTSFANLRTLYRCSPQMVHLLGVLIVLSLALILNGPWLPPDIVQLSPLPTLRRIVPGLSYLPFEIVLYAVCVTLLAVVLALCAQGAHLMMFAIGLLVVVYVSGDPMRMQLPRLRGEHDIEPWQEIENEHFSCPQSAIESALLSPSYYVIKVFGVQNTVCAGDTSVLQSNAAKIPLTNISLKASSQEQDLQFAIDGNDATRWSPQGGTQHGNEWILLDLGSERHGITGIEAAVGTFTTDFPRGLEVRYSAQCGTDEKSLSSYVMAYHSPTWQGAVRKSADGFPYFGPQNEVTINFVSPINARCILIRQIGSEDHFDWSVAEITLYEGVH